MNSKEKELLAQYIFTIFADNGVSIDNDIIDKLADGLIARGYGRIDKFAEELKTLSIAQMTMNRTYLCIAEEDIDELLEEYKNESN